MTTPRLTNQSLGDLFKQLINDVSALAQAELAVAKAEYGATRRGLASGVGMFAGAALFVVIAIACLVAASIAALSLVMPTWLAALIVAVICCVIAAILALIGRSVLRKTGSPVPVNAIAAAKEDVEWVKTHAKPAAR